MEHAYVDGRERGRDRSGEEEESGGEWHPKDWDGVDAEEWPGGSQGLGDAG